MDDDGTGHASALAPRNKADGFQTQFDVWILGAILFGLICASLFGGFAGACAVTPERPATAAASPSATPSAPASSPVPGATPTAPPPVPQPAATPSTPPRATGTPTATSSLSAVPAVSPRPMSLGGDRVVACNVAGSGALGALMAIIIGLAAFAIGAFIGFLFGLPRTLTGPRDGEGDEGGNPPDTAGTGTTDAAGAIPAPGGKRPWIGSGVNTNLERVSDWLTTIIVGVGLTKLERVPSVFRELGGLIDPYFGSGGWIYAIAATIYFSVVGFFFVYVGTRVKLSLIFVLSQRNNDETANTVVFAQIAAAKAAPPVPSSADAAAMNATGGQTSGAQGTLQQADEALLKRSLTDLKTNDEVIAWSNAKARQLDFAAALTGYQDVLKKVPATPELSTAYATILAAVGDQVGADGVIAGLQATSQITPDGAVEARARVSNASASVLRARLQAALSSTEERAYEQAIEAGEALFALPDQTTDAEAHMMLARAYGRRLWASIPPDVVPPDPLPADIQADVDRAVEQVKLAVGIDAAQKNLALQLYDPTQVGEGKDLQPLYPLMALSALLDTVPPEEPQQPA